MPVTWANEFVNQNTRPRRRRQWGRWQYRSNRTLTIDTGTYTYEIDLDECTSVGRVLDWLMHMRIKTWITSADLGDLLMAFDDIFNGYARLVEPTRKTSLDAKTALKAFIARPKPLGRVETDQADTKRERARRAS